MGDRKKLSYKHSDGYNLIHDSESRHAYRKRVLEHIIIYEETHNCCLLKWGIVHHRDGNKTNNIWYNLQGMTRGKHILLHKLMERNSVDKSLFRCVDCGSHETTMHKSRKNGNSYPYWHKLKTNKSLFRCNMCYQRHRKLVTGGE